MGLGPKVALAMIKTAQLSTKGLFIACAQINTFSGKKNCFAKRMIFWRQSSEWTLSVIKGHKYAMTNVQNVIICGSF